MSATTDIDADGRVPPLPTTDVWSRWGARYRVRAVVLLGVNVILFAGVGCFAFWLRSGEPFAPLMPNYGDHFLQTFRFAGNNDVSLGLLLLEPISVQDVPMQIPILGLLMAALISIPILVAMLYRFWWSVPFILVVGFLAVMPWLAITLLISCLVTSTGPFRTRYRFVSALIALLPAVVYLALAWRGSEEVIGGRIDPADGIKFVAPWVLAIVAAAAVFAVVLTLARIVGYRPGAITPLLAVMFVLPAALFEFHVGRDELYYRLLEGLYEAHFAPADASMAYADAAWRAYRRHPLPRPKWETVRDIEEQKWLFELAADLAPYRSELTRHQEVIAQRCDRFVDQFPQSRYASNALFLKARALDMRVDTAAFRETKWIRFYDEFPSVRSRGTWDLVVTNYPDSLVGAVGGLRLAQLDARNCDIDRAITGLNRAIAVLERCASDGASASGEGPLKGVLARGAPESTLGVPLEEVQVEAVRLRGLLVANRDPIYNYEPICGTEQEVDGRPYGLTDLDPRSRDYSANLDALLSRYPHCTVADNILLGKARAAMEPDRRIALLNDCLERYPDGDAAAEALLRLGIAYREGGNVNQSEAAFERLLARFPDSVWADQVYQHWPRARGARLTQAVP